MERSEPTLVPEWLRSSGSVTSGGSSTHHSASSYSHSDISSSVHQVRNRSSRSRNDVNSPRSSFLDQTSSSSSSSWRSSSNGPAKHAYSSFSRNHHDKDRDRNTDRLSYFYPWERDSSDPLGILSSTKKDGLRHFSSMVSRKQGELLPPKDLKTGGKENNGNDILSRPSSSIGTGMHKAVFDKDFPSLGSEDRQGVNDMSRVSSPSLISAVQNLPIGCNSSLVVGEGWTSALAEVPNVVGSSNLGSIYSSFMPPLSTSSSQISVPAQTGPMNSSATPGLKMAEALAQAPSRTHTLPQVSVKMQRLEELAIKQSRQLIPVTPSMPKGLDLSSSDKSKTRSGTRTGEVSLATSRGWLQEPSTSPHASQSLPGGQIKSDSSKTSQGKLFILKPSWENGVSPSKDVASPNSNANGRAPSNPLAVRAPSITAAPSRTSNGPRERKSSSLNMMPGLSLEKKPYLSQTQSRNDFFKLLKQKSSTNMYPVPGPCDSPSVAEKPEVSKEEVSSLASPHETVNSSEITNNGDASEEARRFSQVEEKNLSFEAAWYPNEEEAAFLRSLGWEENSEDEGLTEEEIDAFKEYINQNLSLKVCRGFQPKLSEIQETSVDGSYSDSSSSSSGSDT